MHFKYRKDQVVGPDSQWVIDAKLGEGTFGRVLRCYPNTEHARERRA